MNELRNDLPFAFQLRDVLPLEVGNADGLCLALAVCLFQLPIPFEPVSRGLVDIQQIDVLDAEPFKGFLHRIFILIFAGPKLGGEEDLFSPDAGIPHTAADRALIHIGVCRVDEPIPHLQRFPDAVFRILRREHKGADAHDRAADPIVQNDGFHSR